MMAVFMLGSISLTRTQANEQVQRRWAVVVIVLLTLLGSIAGCQSSSPPEEIAGSNTTLPDPLPTVATVERLPLIEEDSTDLDYSDGKTYVTSVVLNHAGDGNINYTFRFCDNQDCTAPGNAVGIAVQDNQLMVN